MRKGCDWPIEAIEGGGGLIVRGGALMGREEEKVRGWDLVRSLFDRCIPAKWPAQQPPLFCHRKIKNPDSGATQPRNQR